MFDIDLNTPEVLNRPSGLRNSISSFRNEMKELISSIYCDRIKWRKITHEDLNLDYGIMFPKSLADRIFNKLENTLEYFSGDLAKVKVFGKWHPIPRQQVSYGDPGLIYKFSGNSIPALPWTGILLILKDKLFELTNYNFNFALINRYRDGNDHIGEHRDAEAVLDPTAPIVSLSFGQMRTFVLKHRDARKSGDAKRKIDPVKLSLEHGSILMMNPPTNEVWYHSLPVQKTAKGVRINITLRKYRNM